MIAVPTRTDDRPEFQSERTVGEMGAETGFPRSVRMRFEKPGKNQFVGRTAVHKSHRPECAFPLERKHDVSVPGNAGPVLFTVFFIKHSQFAGKSGFSPPDFQFEFIVFKKNMVSFAAGHQKSGGGLDAIPFFKGAGKFHLVDLDPGIAGKLEKNSFGILREIAADPATAELTAGQGEGTFVGIPGRCKCIQSEHLHRDLAFRSRSSGLEPDREIARFPDIHGEMLQFFRGVTEPVFEFSVRRFVFDQTDGTAVFIAEIVGPLPLGMPAAHAVFE